MAPTILRAAASKNLIFPIQVPKMIRKESVSMAGTRTPTKLISAALAAWTLVACGGQSATEVDARRAAGTSSQQPAALLSVGGSPNGVSNLTKIELQLLAADSIAFFKWKVESVRDNCKVKTGWSEPQVPSEKFKVDVSELPDGDVFLCFLPMFEKTDLFNPSLVAITSWTKDTTPPTAQLSGQIGASPTQTRLDVTVASEDRDIKYYRYAVGLASAIDCKNISAYGAPTESTAKITDDLAALPNGRLKFCLTVIDEAGNMQTLPYIEVTWTSNITTTPAVVKVYALSAGPFKAGDMIQIAVKYSAAVSVTGTPSLALLFGTSTTPVNATYLSGSGTNTLIFGYTVPGGLNAASVATNGLAGTVARAGTSSVAASSTLPGPTSPNSLSGSGSTPVVDTTPPPNAAISSPASGAQLSSQFVTVSGSGGESGTSVFVYGFSNSTATTGGTLLGSAVVAGNGQWSVVVGVTPGTTTWLRTIAQDAAGNTSAQMSSPVSVTFASTSGGGSTGSGTTTSTMATTSTATTSTAGGTTTTSGATTATTSGTTTSATTGGTTTTSGATTTGSATTTTSGGTTTAATTGGTTTTATTGGTTTTATTGGTTTTSGATTGGTTTTATTGSATTATSGGTTTTGNTSTSGVTTTTNTSGTTGGTGSTSGGSGTSTGTQLACTYGSDPVQLPGSCAYVNNQIVCPPAGGAWSCPDSGYILVRVSGLPKCVESLEVADACGASQFSAATTSTGGTTTTAATSSGSTGSGTTGDGTTGSGSSGSGTSVTGATGTGTTGDGTTGTGTTGDGTTVTTSTGATGGVQCSIVGPATQLTPSCSLIGGVISCPAPGFNWACANPANIVALYDNGSGFEPMCFADQATLNACGAQSIVVEDPTTGGGTSGGGDTGGGDAGGTFCPAVYSPVSCALSNGGSCVTATNSCQCVALGGTVGCADSSTGSGTTGSGTTGGGTCPAGSVLYGVYRAGQLDRCICTNLVTTPDPNCSGGTTATTSTTSTGGTTTASGTTGTTSGTGTTTASGTTGGTTATASTTSTGGTTTTSGTTGTNGVQVRQPRQVQPAAQRPPQALRRQAVRQRPRARQAQTVALLTQPVAAERLAAPEPARRVVYLELYS